MPETLTTAAPPKIEATAPPVPHALLSLCLPDDWTLDDTTLEQLDELNPGWRIERGFSGELVINMGAGGHGPTIGFKLCMRLGLWVEEIGGGLGQDGTAGYNLLDDEGRTPEWEPDVSWISPEQLAAAGGSAPIRGFWNLCPTFVVEIVSPDQSVVSQQDKMVGWIHFGAQLGWLVDPESRTVWIYRPGAEPEQRERPDSVDGESVLSGFEFSFEPIWKMLDEADAADAAHDAEQATAE